MNNLPLIYFAYGSNLSLAQMRKRCPKSRLISKGCLHGYQLEFDCYASGWGCGVADVVIKPNKKVWGLVFAVSTQDLKSLDIYEGHPNFYRRFQISIETPKGILDGVWVYEVCNKQDFQAPNRKYLAIIQKASRDFEFPQAYQEFLDSIPTAD